MTVNRGDPPVLKEYFGDVKAESSYANSNGEVTDIKWNGQPYMLNGEALRNATATLTEAFKVYAVNLLGYGQTARYRGLQSRSELLYGRTRTDRHCHL